MTAIAAQIAGYRSLVDGSTRLSVDLPTEHVPLWVLKIGQSVAIAPLDLSGRSEAPSAAEERSLLSTPTSRHPYGQEARVLRLSGFCRAPEVWKRIGPDAEFLRWVATQPCAASDLGHCQGDVVAAHVRRIADGAGVGIKPPYSAIPLCHFHHSIQHAKGETALWPRETWDLYRLQAVEDWAWGKLRELFHVEHVYDLEPKRLWEWAAERGIHAYLPAVYRPVG